jgi:hypothetical protein
VSFSGEAREGRRKWHTICKCWKQRTLNGEFYIWKRYPSEMRRK